MLIIGKQNFIEIVENLLCTKNIKRVYLHGIIDKELISLIKRKTSHMEEKLDFRVAIQHIPMNGGILNSRFLNSEEIRTNIKCRSKFILIDNSLFFLSGKDKNLPYHLEDKDLIIKLEENKLINDLDKIFLKNWKSGMSLYI